MISRGSTFRYRDRETDLSRVAEDLQVDYVLQGSVSCPGDRFRVHAQLAMAETGDTFWAERYDGRRDALYALQDEIAGKIVGVILPEINTREMRRAQDAGPDNPQALDLAWKARAMLEQSRIRRNPALYVKGLELAETAAAMDPNCSQAWQTIALGNYVRAFAGTGGDVGAWLQRAREAAEAMRALDRNDHRAYLALGWIGYLERDLDGAVINLSHARDLNPSCAMSSALLGVVKTSIGEADAGYAHIQAAMRLSPRDYWLGFMQNSLGFACFALARFGEGAELARLAIHSEPAAPANHVILAACLSEMGDLAGAADAIRRQRTVNEDYLTRLLERKRPLFQDQDLTARFTAALTRAVAAAEQEAD